jgi:hypothetical protein
MTTELSIAVKASIVLRCQNVLSYLDGWPTTLPRWLRHSFESAEILALYPAVAAFNLSIDYEGPCVAQTTESTANNYVSINPAMRSRYPITYHA